MACCTPTRLKWTTFGVACLFVVLGLFLVFAWRDIFALIANHELSLASRNTQGFKMWKKTPIPMYAKFYMFNWTNSEEVTKSNWQIPPKLEECGPYVFSEVHIRENIIFNSNDTITFNTRRIWHFEPDLTTGSLTDRIITINPIAAAIGSVVKYKHKLVREGINFILQDFGEKFVINKEVNEYIFEGYDDPLIKLAKKLKIHGINIPFKKFGWFAERNGSVSYDGVFNMYNGADDIENLGRITTWNYSPHLPIFTGSCATVDGTSGELWYPTRGLENVQIFSPDICGSVNLHLDSSMEFLGIKGDKYVGRDDNFDNGTKYPSSSCYLPEDVPLQLNGVRNISQCKYGAPAFVSYPHFYLGDPTFRQNVEGMIPNKSIHEFSISLEPSTGLPLKVAAPFQVNIWIEGVPNIDILQDVKPMMFPMFWFKQEAELSESLGKKAKLLIVMPDVGVYTGFGFLGIGGLLFIIFAVVTYRKGWNSGSDEETLLSQQAL